ncbi:hypothetical protein CC86DRAFT_411662 [Ophiobolus disseminans]|uniref:Uncharacterized protein n=1 Tax=Ophiobolus disseminans TaxID=1469910 RepID=A0A6A6ZIC7_9PLEO|nr:hypothetical protein CC86DRAFT_411662 [Ophiobolus disseminans]
MFKAATQKEITVLQQTQRVLYTTNKRFKKVEGYWDSFMFTDKAHCSLSDFPDEWILRVFSKRYKPENIVEQSEELTFYNDKYDDVELVKLPPRLRRRLTTETEAQ